MSETESSKDTNRNDRDSVAAVSSGTTITLNLHHHPKLDYYKQRETSYRECLISEQPKIDAALKSYASWMLATTTTATQDVATHPPPPPQQQQQQQPEQKRRNHHRQQLELGDVLRWTRILSQTINRHLVAVTTSSTNSCIRSSNNSPEKKINYDDDDIEEKKDEWKLEVLAQVWNNVVAMKSKPTKVLGRMALQGVWQDLEFAVGGDPEDHVLLRDIFLPPFEKFLMDNKTDLKCGNHHSSSSSSGNDARLIWDDDRGVAELSRRAQERQLHAARRQTIGGDAGGENKEDEEQCR